MVNKGVTPGAVKSKTSPLHDPGIISFQPRVIVVVSLHHDKPRQTNLFDNIVDPFSSLLVGEVNPGRKILEQHSTIEKTKQNQQQPMLTKSIISLCSILFARSNLTNGRSIDKRYLKSQYDRLKGTASRN